MKLPFPTKPKNLVITDALLMKFWYLKKRLVINLTVSFTGMFVYKLLKSIVKNTKSVSKDYFQSFTKHKQSIRIF